MSKVIIEFNTEDPSEVGSVYKMVAAIALRLRSAPSERWTQHKLEGALVDLDLPTRLINAIVWNGWETMDIRSPRDVLEYAEAGKLKNLKNVGVGLERLAIERLEGQV